MIQAQCYRENAAYRENRKQQWKDYYRRNKAARKQKIQCECGGQYSHQGRSQHFKTIKHKDFINTRIVQIPLAQEEKKARQKIAQKKKDDKINAIKHTCECGGVYIKKTSSKTRHEKTKKHQFYANSK